MPATSHIKNDLFLEVFMRLRKVHDD